MDSSELVRRHVTHMTRRGLRPNTIDLRVHVLRRLELHAGKSLLRVTLEDLQAFLDRLTDSGSRSTEATQVRVFYRWAALEGYISSDPSFRLDRIKKRKYLPRPIPDETLGKALMSPPERITTMLWLAAYAGLRACDIAQLRGEHLLYDRDPPMVFIEESKGGKPRSVPMAPLLAQELRGRLPSHGWCYPYLNGREGHIPAQYVSKLCNDYLHSIGTSETLHQLRHWAITEWYHSSGRDLVVTQQLAGHESIATTRLYTWVDPGDGALAVSRMKAL